MQLSHSFGYGWEYRRLLQTNTEAEPVLEEGNDDDRSVPLWMFFVIPIISAIVGYGTNVIALKMSFYPIEFTGIKLWQPEGQPFGFFGWQGIVPSRARIMAARLTELFLGRLLDLQEMFGRIDPEIVKKQCEPATQVLSDRIIQETMDLLVPHVYESLAPQTRREIRSAIAGQTDAVVSALMVQTQTRILELLDLVQLMGRLAEENKEQVVTMFLELGRVEYRHVQLSGLWFGLLFGCIQAVIYYFYESWWVLPVAGLFVGWFTNYLALTLIFEPTEPIHICGMRIQGVFLKRQEEAAESIADLSQSNFLTVDHMMDEIVSGNGREVFDEILQSITHQHISRMKSYLGGVLLSLLSPEFPARMERVILRVVKEEMGNIWPLAYSHIEDALDLRETLRTKLQALPPKDFVGTLRPVFQEDELKLIVVGAILGMLVGFVQQFLVFQWI